MCGGMHLNICNKTFLENGQTCPWDRALWELTICEFVVNATLGAPLSSFELSRSLDLTLAANVLFSIISFVYPQDIFLSFHDHQPSVPSYLGQAIIYGLRRWEFKNKWQAWRNNRSTAPPEPTELSQHGWFLFFDVVLAYSFSLQYLTFGTSFFYVLSMVGDTVLSLDLVGWKHDTSIHPRRSLLARMVPVWARSKRLEFLDVKSARASDPLI